jgi:hypothetical protein
MEVEFSQIATTPTSLRFGMVARYDSGAVRFVTMVLDDDVLDLDTIQDLLTWLSRQAKKIVDERHRVEDQGEDPLF